jgi:hypothetical protein
MDLSPCWIEVLNANAIARRGVMLHSQHFLPVFSPDRVKNQAPDAAFAKMPQLSEAEQLMSLVRVIIGNFLPPSSPLCCICTIQHV